MWKSKKRMLTFSTSILLAACNLSVLVNGCGEACEKTMTVVGTVTDGSSSPVSGANVFCCTTGETSPKTTTGADGKYSFSTSNMGGFKDTQARFEKPGYTTTSATSFSETEAGVERCGSYSVTRDVILSP
ncbi:MAG: carboxypeptidase regulatory-like domain-containing protein [Bdellovibrionales bacterium]|nr:carboxypeptidase regulatory-like domain-containing protein [Bdellovibrionales bacterium]